MNYRRTRRKRRDGEVVCRCAAYRFPHRTMGGRCDGGAIVDRFFATHMHDACRDCHLREQSESDGYVCAVLDGREPTRECPALDEFIRFNSVRLYGVNKPPERLGALRR